MQLTLGWARLSEMDRKAKGSRKMETRLVRLEPHIAPACVYASEGGKEYVETYTSQELWMLSSVTLYCQVMN